MGIALNKDISFRKIFDAVVWAAVKAMLFASVIPMLQLGFVLHNLSEPKELLSSLAGAFGMTIIGYVLLLPILGIFSYVIGAPLTILILKRGWFHLFTLILVGAFTTFIFFGIIPAVFIGKKPPIEALASSGLHLLCAGALTGFFLHRQLLKTCLHQLPKHS